jgi:hypothetical protein
MSESSAPRTIACAFVVGLMFAVFNGLGMSGSGLVSNSGTEAQVTPRVQTVFSPTFALLGFCLGAPIGAAIGFLWSRSGLGRAFGITLVSLLGGFIGLMAAGLLGDETHFTRSGNAFSMTHGPTDTVLICGATMGMLIGALFAWQFGPTKRATDFPRLPA